MIGSLQNLHPEEASTLDNLIEGYQLIGFDWRYLYVNMAVVKQSKYSKDELLGYTMMEKYPGIEETELFRALKKCMSRRESRFLDNEFKFPDGSSGWFELRIQPVPEGLFILSIDITEKKKAEKEKREYITGLERIIHMTSHKVRQPVTQIMGVSNMLEHVVHSKSELQRISSYLKESISTLDDFTRELTHFIHDMESKAKKWK